MEQLQNQAHQQEAKSKVRSKPKTLADKLESRKLKLLEAQVALENKKETLLKEQQKIKEEEAKLAAEADQLMLETLQLTPIKEMLMTKSLEELTSEEFATKIINLT